MGRYCSDGDDHATQLPVTPDPPHPGILPAVPDLRPVGWLRWWADLDPSRPALIDQSGSVIGYGALDALVSQRSGAILEAGVSAGARVAVVAQRTLDTVVSLWALWAIGAVAVVVDPATRRGSLPPEWGLAAILDGAVIQPLAPGPSSTELRPAAGSVREGASLPDASLPDASDPLDRHHTWVPTSGSSGAPRAVVLTAGNVAAAVHASQLRLGNGPDDRWLLVLPLFHVGGLSVLWRSVAAGGAVTIHRRFETGAIAAALAAGSVTIASLVPTMLYRLIEAGVVPSPSLRMVLVGGAAAAPGLVRGALDAGYPVLTSYGATEACSQIATVAPGRQLTSIGTVGTPLEAMKVEIAAADGSPVGPGEIGEILVSGPAVSPGYAGEPPRSGPHHTGDLGRWEGDALVVVGRADDVIISGGENIVPQTVEAILTDHPDVELCVVHGEPDSEWGAVVAAVVQPPHGVVPSPGDLDDFARRRLPPAQRPRRWRFVAELPLLANGKLDRALAAGPSPEQDQFTDAVP